MASEPILIVEDERIIARDIQQRLSRLGYTVSAIASSGVEALHKTADLSPALVLMDIVLKGNMDGVEAAVRLQAQRDVPIVYLTAYADDTTLQRAMATGPYGYVMKPIVDKQLHTAIAIALDKHRAAHALREHQQMDEDQLQARKLEAIGTLAGGIAHTFNNILTAIIGHLSLAKRLAQPHAPIYEHLSQSEQAAQQATDVTHQLLTFAEGGVPIKRRTALGPLLHDALTMALQNTPVQGAVSVPEALWMVEADSGQLRQVIDNVSRNAIEAMPYGGTLRAEAQNLLVDRRQRLPVTDGPYIKLTLTDQGIGIPRQHLQRIFDPYFTTKTYGRGLGLATARSIIQKHAGYISVESTGRAGTTIAIYLPALPDTPPVRRETTGSHPTRTSRILVVDDDDSLRRIVPQMLAHLGYEAVGAATGEEALVLYQQAQETDQPFAAVVMDLIIEGGMGGEEAMSKLRAFDPEVRAIVSSGYSNAPVMADFQRYGFRGVLAKPYDMAELAAALQHVIHGGPR
jgi:signal transduction histidine kinase